MTPPDLSQARRLELGISRLLRYGMVIAGCLAAIGGISNLIQHATERIDFGEFRGGAGELTSFTGIVSGAVHLHSPALLQLGIVLLIVTPIARVCFMLVGFIRERDHAYIVISGVVLLVLLYGTFVVAT